VVPYRRRRESVVKHVVPYHRRYESVVNYVVTFRRRRGCVVKYVGPDRRRRESVVKYGGTLGAAPKSGSGSHPGDRAFFIRGTCKSAQYGHLWGGPQEEFQNQVLAAPLAAMFSFSEEHVKTVPFRNLWGGDPRRASKITLKAISFCFLLVSAVWVPKITLNTRNHCVLKD
jgi:hypothetical protein